MIFGKIILAFLGLKLSSWFHFSPLIGVAFGGLIGHIIDISIQRKFANYQAKKYWANVKKAEANRSFVESMFVILGRLAAADGPINKIEEEKFLEIIRKYLKLNRKQLKKLKPLFVNGPAIDGSIQYHTARLFEATNSDENMLFGFYQLMTEFANADGKVTAQEAEILATVGQIIGVPYGRANSYSSSGSSGSSGHQGERRAEPPPAQQKVADPYTVLGCSPSDSTDKIRSQYRKLAGEFHPDKIMGKELSQEFIDFATERFKSVSAAYDQIRQERGF